MITFLSKEMFENKFNINHVCTMQYNNVISFVEKCLRLSSFTKELYCHTFGPVQPLYYELLFFLKMYNANYCL